MTAVHNETQPQARRWAAPPHASEIAEAVLFLTSPRSSFITGSTLHVDGGGAAV